MTLEDLKEKFPPIILICAILHCIDDRIITLGLECSGQFVSDLICTWMISDL